MRRMFVVALAAAAVFFTASVASAQKAEDGLKVYEAKKCSMCHSVAGKGNPKGSLDGVGTKYSAAELKQWIVDAPAMAAKTKAERKPAMPSYKTLPAADVDALVAYLSSLKKK